MDTSILAETFVNEHMFKTMAWVFTILSGVASIALTIHKFGLPVWKQVSLIVGILCLGLFMVVFVIPRLGGMSGPQVITTEQQQQIQAVEKELSSFSEGYEVTDQGIVTKAAVTTVNRVSEFVYAVQQPNGSLVVVYSGTYFDATIDGKTVECELLSLPDDRVLIVKGNNETEIVDLNSDQEGNTFKVQRVPVSSRKESNSQRA